MKGNEAYEILKANKLKKEQGDRLRIVRKQNKLTQKEFAESIGLLQSSYTNIENGVRSMTNQTMKLVCQNYNINEKWLLTGEGEQIDNAPKKSLLEKIKNEYDFKTELQCKAMELFLKATDEQRELTVAAVKTLIEVFKGLGDSPSEEILENEDETFSNEELELIKKYRSLSVQAQERIQSSINLEYEQTKNFVEESSIEAIEE